MNSYTYEKLHKRFIWWPTRTESGKLRWMCWLYCEVTAYWVDIGYWRVDKFYTEDEALIKTLTGRK